MFTKQYFPMPDGGYWIIIDPSGNDYSIWEDEEQVDRILAQLNHKE